MTETAGLIADQILKTSEQSASTNTASIDVIPRYEAPNSLSLEGDAVVVWTLHDPHELATENYQEAEAPESYHWTTCLLPVTHEYAWPDVEFSGDSRLYSYALDEPPRDYILYIKSEAFRANIGWSREDSLHSLWLPDTEGSPFDELASRSNPSDQIQSLITSIRNDSTRPDYDEIADRLAELVEAAEEEEDTDPPSPDSLRGMVALLRSDPGLKTPGIVLTAEGNFRAVWQAGENRHFAVEFLPSGECRYVVFAPDLRDSRRTIRTSGIAHFQSLLDVLAPLEIARWAKE